MSWRRRRNNVFGCGTTVQLCRARCYGECSQHHWYGVVQEATLRGGNEITTELSCNPGFMTEHHNSVEGERERGRGYKRAYTALNSPRWLRAASERVFLYRINAAAVEDNLERQNVGTRLDLNTYRTKNTRNPHFAAILNRTIYSSPDDVYDATATPPIRTEALFSQPHDILDH